MEVWRCFIACFGKHVKPPVPVIYGRSMEIVIRKSVPSNILNFEFNLPSGFRRSDASREKTDIQVKLVVDLKQYWE